MTIVHTVTQQTASAREYSQSYHRVVWCPEAPAGGEFVGAKSELWTYDGLSAPILRLRSASTSYAGEVGFDSTTGRIVIGVGLSGSPQKILLAVDITTLYDDDGNPVAQGAGTQTLGFYGATPVTRPTVNWYSNDAPTLKALCAALVSLGLISGVEVAV